MRRVIVESPLSGNVQRNIIYARAAVLDCLRRGEAPFASHLLYTQVLDDEIPEDRELGISAGLEFIRVADGSVVYTDLGISQGMAKGIAVAQEANKPIEYRRLSDWSRMVEIFKRFA